MLSPIMNAHHVSLAVVAGHPDGDGFALKQGQFHGTAFCMAPDLFLTAAHVYRNAREVEQVAVARFGPGRNHIQLVEEAELFEGIDLAIMRVPGLKAEIRPLYFEPLNLLDEVFSLGYPFGFESHSSTLYLRGFKGYIVTRRTLNMPDMTEAPSGYEVSFIPPLGLSGAPLLSLIDGGPCVVGMILKHHVTNPGAESTMQLGLALDTEQLLTLESRIIGGSVAEILFDRPQLRR